MSKPRIPLVYTCQDPADYVRMFEVPCATCMVIQKKGAPFALWRHMVRAFNIHPASWYHFLPNTHGVWLEDANGRPVARCMIYTTLNGTFFGDLKYTENSWANMLGRYLATELKYTFAPSKHENMRRTTKAFMVPAYNTNWLSEGLVCPLPHCDMQLKDFSVTFHPAGSGTIDPYFMFYPDALAPKRAFKVVDTYRHNGFLRATEVLKRRARYDFVCAESPGKEFYTLAREDLAKHKQAVLALRKPPQPEPQVLPFPYQNLDVNNTENYWPI